MNKKIIFFIILVLLLGIVFLKKKTKFTEFIRLESDFYIPKKDNIIDFKQKSINAHRICIYDDSDPNNVDLECINANELITTLNLPPQRKNQVCIDNKCLTRVPYENKKPDELEDGLYERDDLLGASFASTKMMDCSDDNDANQRFTIKYMGDTQNCKVANDIPKIERVDVEKRKKESLGERTDSEGKKGNFIMRD